MIRVFCFSKKIAVVILLLSFGFNLSAGLPKSGRLNGVVSFFKHSKKTHPKPTTQIIQEKDFDGKDESKEKLMRQTWIESMHKCSPQTNWRAIEEQNKEEIILKNSNILYKKQEQVIPGKLSGLWKEKGSNNVAGRIVYVDYDPQEDNLYVGTGGGNLFKGKKDRSYWQSINTHFQLGGITMVKHFTLPTGKKRLIAASNGSRIYYSDDDGQTFKKSLGLNNIESWGSIYQTIMTNDSLKTIYVLAQDFNYSTYKTQTSIYYSINNGKSFKLSASFKNDSLGATSDYALFSQQNGSGKAYFMRDSVLFGFDKSFKPYRIGGSTKIGSGTMRFTASETSKTGIVFYAMVNGNINQSIDNGKTWTFKSNYSTNLGSVQYETFFADPNKSSNLYIGEVNFAISKNGGKSFSNPHFWYDYYNNINKYFHADAHYINKFRDSLGKPFFIFANDGGLYTAGSQFDSIQNISLAGLNTSMYYSTFTDLKNTQYTYAGAQDQGFQRSVKDTGGLMDFKQDISGDYGHITSSDSGASFWTQYPTFIMYYPDGHNYSGTLTATFTGKGKQWLPAQIADPKDPSQVFCAAGSSDSGAKIWTYKVNTNNIIVTEGKFNFGTNGHGNITAIHISKTDYNKWYVLTENGFVFNSFDAGKSWSINKSISKVESHYFYGASITSSAKNGALVWIAGSGYNNPGFYSSKDSGKTFTKDTLGLGRTLIYSIDNDTSDEFVYAATEAGPKVFDIKQRKWFNMQTSSGVTQNYWSVQFIPSLKTVRFGTYGRGIWDFNITDTNKLTLINPIKNELNSIKIFPNPTHDRFSLVTQMPINEIQSVTILNQNGVILNTWTNIMSNNFEVSTLPKGIYFVKISLIGGKNQVERLVLE